MAVTRPPPVQTLKPRSSSTERPSGPKRNFPSAFCVLDVTPPCESSIVTESWTPSAGRWRYDVTRSAKVLTAAGSGWRAWPGAAMSLSDVSATAAHTNWRMDCLPGRVAARGIIRHELLGSAAAACQLFEVVDHAGVEAAL